MSKEEKTSLLPLEDAAAPGGTSEGTRRPDVIENHIPDVVGGRFALAMKDVNLNNERRYNARMRRIKAQVRRVDPNYHPQISDSYFFRLSVGKERYCNLYRVGLSDMCTVLAAPELHKKEGRVHLYHYWQPNYDSTRLELYYRLNSFTEQNAKRELRLHAIWDLNAVCMMMQNYEDLKLSRLLKTGKRRSHSISGILHPRAYQGALATEARRNILLLPFELIAAHEKIMAYREEKVGDIIQTLAEGPEKQGELTKAVADFVAANREWVARAISCSMFGEQLPMPRHEYQLTKYLHTQKPIVLDSLHNQFTLMPYWVGHGAHFVRCRKKNLKIQWTGRSPAAVNTDGNTRPIKLRPTTLSSAPPAVCNIVISTNKDDAELAIPQPNSKPGSIASGGPDTCTVSTATTTPMSFMHDWRYTSTHADYDHRLSSGPPKGCETAVNLEWRMRVNAEKQRRLNMLTSDGLVCHTTDVRYSSHGWGRAYREMQKRDNQFRRAQPFYQSRFLPSPDVHEEMKKEIDVRERVRELTGLPADQQTEAKRSELKAREIKDQRSKIKDHLQVLQHVLNQMALRRAIRTPDYRGTGKSLWASTGMFNPAIDVIQHSISYTDRPIEELIDRISINPAIRVAAQSDLLSRRVVELIATVVDVRRNLLVPLNIPYSSKIGVLRPTTRTDVLSNDSLLDRSPLFIVLLGALFLVLNASPLVSTASLVGMGHNLDQGSKEAMECSVISIRSLLFLFSTRQDEILESICMTNSRSRDRQSQPMPRLPWQNGLVLIAAVPGSAYAADPGTCPNCYGSPPFQLWYLESRGEHSVL